MRNRWVHVLRGVVVLATGFGPTRVAAYWVSVVYAMYGVGEVADGWPEMIAGIAECATVVFGSLIVTALWRQRNSRPVKTLPRHLPATGRAMSSARIPGSAM